jgi:hypothetical protein
MPLAVRIVGSYAIAIVVVLALEWFPLTGVVLMMLLGPLWVSLLVNAMLIHLGVAALRGQISRTWLTAPIAVYGAWIVWVAQANVRAQATMRALEASNVVTEPVAQDADLLFEKDDEFAAAVKKFVRGGRVFAGLHEIQVITADNCIHVPNVGGGERFYGYFRATPDYEDRRSCAITRFATPPNEGIRFRKVVSLAWSETGERTQYEISRVAPDGGESIIGHFSYGYVSAPSFWPLFWMGCYLNSSGPSWACGVRPMTRYVSYGVSRQASGFDVPEVRADVLGTMLGRAIRQRVPI